jgi:LPXTG-motif cell wall-anchored protein
VQHHGGGASLWLTGLGFGALLIGGVAWLWTRRRMYDAA